MDAVVYLDTHVIAWLYAGRLDLLPNAVKELLEKSQLLHSPMAALELQYLFEIGRVSEPAENVCASLSSSLGLKVCSLPFPLVAQAATRADWTRDPFDRLITAQASLAEKPLITKDGAIRKRYSRATWD